MARARDWLDRFRPAGGPGAPSAAGVPADRRAAATAELEPVFAALADVTREAARVRTTAATEASALVTAADERARALLARTRVEAEAARSAEEARVRGEATTEAARMTEEATVRAQAAGDRVASMREDVVARVVGRVRTDLTDVARAPRGARPRVVGP